jgi:hypothetical protein
MVCFLAIHPLVKAQSLGQDDVNSIYNDTVWYQQNGGAGCSVTVDTNLSGNDEKEKAFNFFITKGLSPIQSAAILGNFMQESGVLPTRVQGGGESNIVPLDGKTGYGLAQWTYLARQQALVDYAKQTNLPVYTLELQLNFTWHESTSDGTMSNFKTINKIEAATEYWMSNYEKPAAATANLPGRIKFANDFLALYSGTGGSTITVPATSGGCTATAPGQDSQFIDGFIIYSQYDPRWANKPYGTSTIAISGCGPSAMAMIITALTGQSITPDITAAYATSQNLYVPGAGSSWDIGSVLAQHWGLNATSIPVSQKVITAHLQARDLVIAAGQGSLPFTSGGHFIVIRGVAADGNWMIGDSGHSNTSSQEWDPQAIISNMSQGSVYAISK